MKKTSKIYVAGHRGLVGTAICRNLATDGFENIITASHSELDLCSQLAVDDFFAKHQPEYIFLAAAKVGGIMANSSKPVDFLVDNLRIELNIITAAHKYKCKKILFLGSSCIYPKLTKQPITEDALLSGSLEPTNEWYAIAKIAGIKLCQAYRQQFELNAISCMPTNLYGPNDNFDLTSSHVLPALMRKIHEAKINNKKEVVVWGTGNPLREFLHVDDLAQACLFLMKEYNSPEIINIGTGSDLSIKELAELIKNIIGFDGNLVFDTDKPDGTPRKVLDVSKINNLGWTAKIPFREGIKSTYKWFLENN